MREFLQPGIGLANLQPSTRLALGLFLGLTLASFVVMAALGCDRSGLGVHSIAEYYAGPPGGEPKSRGELLELTHFHLFSMPLLLFVQGHLFLMTRWPRRVKLGILYAAFLGCALDLAAPWLAVYVSPDLAVLKVAARALLGPSLLAFAVVPLWEMWTRSSTTRREENESGSPLGVE